MTEEAILAVAESYSNHKMKFFHLINYNSLIICIGLIFISLLLFSFVYRSKLLIIVTLLSLTFGILLITYVKIQSNTDDQKYITEIIKTNDHTVVYLYSNFWAACVAYKPQVLRLKNNVSNIQVNYIEYEISSNQAKDFIEIYNYKSVPHIMLINKQGIIVNKWQSIPDITEINKFISK